MAVRDVDVVIEALGSNAFQPFKGPAGADLSQYEAVKKRRGSTRTLLSICCGADEDLGPNRDVLITEIQKATGNQLARLGAVCLYGTSNACSLMLSLAKKLQILGAPKITYIGVADVTMIPFERKPEVPDIGNLQPIPAIPPTVSFGLRVGPTGGALTARAIPPLASKGPPPEIPDPGVNADIRENYFTVQGNRARVFANSPVGRFSWWWTSLMKHGEVHGRIPTWTNIPKMTTNRQPLDDDGHHMDLCGKAIVEMRKNAGTALAAAVEKLP